MAGMAKGSTPRAPAIESLEDLLDQIGKAAGDSGSDRVTLRQLMTTIGRRSFGPLLLFTGLITLSPVGDIPGVPTITAGFVFAIGIQALFGRREFWVPAWLLKLSVEKRRVDASLRWLRKPARFVDRLSRPRLQVFTVKPATYVIAAACVAVAMAMPPMEVVPFSASGAGAALTAFGLALVAHDGLLALLAFAVTVGTLAFVVYKLV